ncbi:MAG: type I-C CRISPR-associated endonuclease Cas1c [Eubacteriales bacterium]|nr:type I-C CRISPR-associated endonuclease Cas1c [Eubacteriales bacterium]
MKKLLNTLYVSSPESYLSLDGENVVLKQNDEIVGRVPLHNIDRIVSFGYRGVSPALMGKCVKDQIELVFLNMSGKFLARVEGSISGNVLLRKRQFEISENESQSIDIVKNMIAGKIYNSRQVLLRTVRDHSQRIDAEQIKKKAEYLQTSLDKCRSVDTIDSLRGIEGEAASIYFSVFDQMILQQKGTFIFEVRSKRPPMDKVNALLSFSYSLCTSMCGSALESVGLDPYVGYLHTDRPGRRSLALDLVEEFRAWMCDRFVLSLINKKLVTEDDFIQKEDGAVFLTDEGRTKFLTAWQNRKNETITHPFLEEKIEWGMLPYVQALLLARYMRGDLDGYPVFLWK